MKTQNNNNILQGLNQNTLNQLVTVVNETVATNVVLPSLKSNLVAADLWNIQRMRKTQLVSSSYRNRFSVL